MFIFRELLVCAPRISSVLTEPERFQIRLFYRAFPGKIGIRFCEKALWRRSKARPSRATDQVERNPSRSRFSRPLARKHPDRVFCDCLALAFARFLNSSTSYTSHIARIGTNHHFPQRPRAGRRQLLIKRRPPPKRGTPGRRIALKIFFKQITLSRVAVARSNSSFTLFRHGRIRLTSQGDWDPRLGTQACP